MKVRFRVRTLTALAALFVVALLAALAAAPVGHAQSTGYVEVTAGREFTCGLKPDGSVACWGDNYWGQAPATRAGPYTHIAAGAYHVCAIKPDMTVDCWGRNTLRISSDSAGSTDVYVGQADPPPGKFKQLAAGDYFSCGLTSEDQAGLLGPGLGPPRTLHAVERGPRSRLRRAEKRRHARVLGGERLRAGFAACGPARYPGDCRRKPHLRDQA